MSIRTRLLSAFLVLLAGACAAAPFQKRRPPGDGASTRQGGLLALPTAAAMSGLLTSPLGGSADAESTTDPQPEAAQPSAREVSESPAVDRPMGSRAPDLPVHFPTAAEASAEETELAPLNNDVHAEPAAGLMAGAEASPPDLSPAAPELKVITRRIRDGDTLNKLAERYLGDASRQAEIFDRNRDVLSDPDLLPIGREIKILVEAARFEE